MSQDPQLTREETSALRMLALAPLMKKPIPAKTLEKLVALKFVEETADGLVVTKEGTAILLKFSR